MDFIPAKSIISAVKPTDNYVYRDFNMNIYRGCTHGCIYCDARSACYHLDRFDEVRGKENTLSLIEDELRHKRKKGIIATGAMSDPYNPMEAEYELTRNALKLIDKYGFGVSITTKSPLVTRDIDIFTSIASHSAVDIRLTITALEDDLSRRIELGVAPSSERFAALAKLANSGVYTGIFITPVLPLITDMPENIVGIVREGAKCGIKNTVCFFGMTLRSGNREYYYAALDREFPGVRERYEKLYGESYECPSPDARQLWNAFTAECGKHGILYDFKSINRTIRGLAGNTQLSLF